MNPEIKSKWVAALRSGEYRQTRGALRDRHGYCCLGVLCDLHSKDHWSEEPNLKDEYRYMDCSLLLSKKVIKWADLVEATPSGNVEIEKGTTLADLNDGKNSFKAHSFEQIADLIEKHL